MTYEETPKKQYKKQTKINIKTEQEHVTDMKTKETKATISPRGYRIFDKR